MGGIHVRSARAAIWCIGVALVSAQSNGSQPVSSSGYDYVDPLIGTVNGGQHVVLPFGQKYGR